MFEKIKKVENFTDDIKDDEKSKRYTILAKKFLDKIEGLRAQIDLEDYDPLNIRENIKHIIDEENIRRIAEKHGMLSMRDSGIARMREGLTDMTEVLYVTAED